MRRPGQAERTRQQLSRLLAGGTVDASLQVTDGPGAQAGRLRQFLLRQLGLGSQLPQQTGKAQSRLFCHSGVSSAGPAPATGRLAPRGTVYIQGSEAQMSMAMTNFPDFRPAQGVGARHDPVTLHVTSHVSSHVW